MTTVHNYYANVLKGWAKAWGSKPTADMFTVIHTLPGPRGRPKQAGVEALHLAMCLRPDGCTVDQYRDAATALLNGNNGKRVGPANNTRHAYRDAGLFNEAIVPGSKPWAYTLTLTAKGKAALKGAMAAQAAVSKVAEKAAKADKAKAVKKHASKPRKPAAAPAVINPVETPVDTTAATH